MKKLLIIISILCLFISYFIYVSYYHLDVTSYKIDSDKINDEVKIVVLGDVHDFHCRIKDKVISRIDAMKPDVILCVGDIIDDKSKSDQDTLTFLKELNKISDVYMSLGNHEIDYYKNSFNKLETSGISLLNGEYEDIEIKGQKIRIGGMYGYAFSNYDGKIKKKSMKNNHTYRFLTEMTNSDSFKLMLAHRPDSFIYGEAYKWDLDLICSGHVHGGQVVLPIIGGLYAPEQGWFPKVDYGLFQKEQMQLLVTRGISSSDEFFPRFNNPGEIMEIILR